MKARPLSQRSADDGSLGNVVIVEDQMHLQRSGRVLIEGVEKLAKLDTAAPAMALSDHGPGLHLQCGKNEVVP
ncbi:MAG: hypothetical protein WKF37_20845 [Bryobacteraceae bacterium]